MYRAVLSRRKTAAAAVDSRPPLGLVQEEKNDRRVVDGNRQTGNIRGNGNEKLNKRLVNRLARGSGKNKKKIKKKIHVNRSIIGTHTGAFFFFFLRLFIARGNPIRRSLAAKRITLENILIFIYFFRLIVRASGVRFFFCIFHI